MEKPPGPLCQISVPISFPLLNDHLPNSRSKFFSFPGFAHPIDVVRLFVYLTVQKKQNHRASYKILPDKFYMLSYSIRHTNSFYKIHVMKRDF